MTLRAIAAVAQVRLKQVCVVFGHRPDLCPCENWNIDVASDDVVTSNEHCGEKRVAGLPGEIQLPLRRPLTSAPTVGISRQYRLSHICVILFSPSPRNCHTGSALRSVPDGCMRIHRNL